MTITFQTWCFVPDASSEVLTPALPSGVWSNVTSSERPAMIVLFKIALPTGGDYGGGVGVGAWGE